MAFGLCLVLVDVQPVVKAGSVATCENPSLASESAKETDSWSCVEADWSAVAASGIAEPQEISANFTAVSSASSDQPGTLCRKQSTGSGIAREIRNIVNKDAISPLRNGTRQVSIGLQYSSNARDQSLRESNNRSATMQIDFTMGLSDSFKASLSIPVVYSNQELVSSSNVNHTDEYGFGDISPNLSKRIARETQNRPRFDLSVGVGMPTGKTVDPLALDQLSLGSGFWSASAGATLSKSLDPASVFLSLRYQHVFEDKQFGVNIRSGSSIEYGYGFGFSINSVLSVTSRIAGAFQADTQINGQPIEGSSSEPLQFVAVSTLRLDRQSRLESSWSMRMNEDADDASFGFTYIRDL